MFLTFKISILNSSNEIDNSWLEKDLNSQANTSSSPVLNDDPVIRLDELKIQYIDGRYFLVKEDDRFIPVTNKQKVIVDNYCISIELNSQKIMLENDNQKSQGLFNFMLSSSNQSSDLTTQKNQIYNKKFEPLFDTTDPLAFLDNSKVFSKS